MYALAWSPDSESVVIGAGKDLAVKGVQVRARNLFNIQGLSTMTLPHVFMTFHLAGERIQLSPGS